MKNFKLTHWMNLSWSISAGILLQGFAVQNSSLIIKIVLLGLSILPFWYFFNYYQKLKAQNIGSAGFWKILKIIFIPAALIWFVSIVISFFG